MYRCYSSYIRSLTLTLIGVSLISCGTVKHKRKCEWVCPPGKTVPECDWTCYEREDLIKFQMEHIDEQSKKIGTEVKPK